jgi:8-oxo-dGTP diphosphatase
MNKTRQAAGIILLNTNKQVLLILRDDNDSIPFPNCWDIPGGYLEAGESPEECVRREIMEEMGIEVSPFQLFREYDREDLHEFIFWKEIELEPSDINLREGQRAAYFTLAQIEEAKLAFQYATVLGEFYSLIVEAGSASLSA